jgi:chitosanase
VKPATRVFLIAAPAAVVVAVAVGVSAGSGPVLADHPPSFASENAAPDPLSTGSDKDRKAARRRIAHTPPGLAAPDKREIAEEIVSSAENSTLDWRSAYGSIQDLGDGNGYTAGVIGFCSGTHDMLQLVEYYTGKHPHNPLAPYLPALRAVDGTDSHKGLDPGFTSAWKQAARSASFQKAQDTMRDRLYFDPAVKLAKADGLGTLGQFSYYDAMVLNGPGNGPGTFYGIRDAALRQAKTPSQGGSERTYLNAFLDADRAAIKRKPTPSQRDTSRIDTAQRVFLDEGNTNLDPPLNWKVYGQAFHIPAR